MSERKVYYAYEPTSYSYALFDMYFDALAKGYYYLDNPQAMMNIEGLKNILLLIASLIRNFNVELFNDLEEMISKIKTEDEFKSICFYVFDACASYGLEVDLYKEVYLSPNSNQTNPKIVELIRVISNNLIYGYQKSTIKSLFIFYLTFRHKLVNKIDELFFDKNIKIYDLTKKVMECANECGVFVHKIPKISAKV